MNTDVMFSSATGEWSTPRDFFEELDREFRFTLDAAASHDNALCNHYFTVEGRFRRFCADAPGQQAGEKDGLAGSWDGHRVWLNPPYGRGIGAWMRKCHEERNRGALVVALVPARTDTAWFHDWVYGKAELRFIRGRLKFGGSGNSAPFPSLVAVYR